MTLRTVTATEGVYYLNSISYTNTNTNFGCCSRSEIIVHPAWWRLEEPDVNSSVKNSVYIYPNPTNGWFMLTGFSEIEEEGIITVSNLAGQVVFDEKVELPKNNNWNRKIVLPAPGMYIVNLRTSNSDFHSTVISINE